MYIDDDGQAYLYWGNPNCYYIKLNADMISTSGTVDAASAASKMARACMAAITADPSGSVSHSHPSVQAGMIDRFSTSWEDTTPSMGVPSTS